MEQLKVLVVDDDPDILETVSQILSLWGHHVIAADGVAAAEAALREFTFDVIVSDWDLAGDRPTSFLQVVRKELPAIGVVLMTGSYVVEVAAAVACGLAHVAVDKPFELEALRLALATARTRAARRNFEIV